MDSLRSRTSCVEEVSLKPGVLGKEQKLNMPPHTGKRPVLERNGTEAGTVVVPNDTDQLHSVGRAEKDPGQRSRPGSSE